MARISPVALMAVLAAAAAGVVAGRAPDVARQMSGDDTWGCGRIGQTPRMEYTSTAFAEPLRRIFGETVPADRRPHGDGTAGLAVPHPGNLVPHATAPVVRAGMYDPLLRATAAFATKVRALQSGSINAYLPTSSSCWSCCWAW